VTSSDLEDQFSCLKPSSEMQHISLLAIIGLCLRANQKAYVTVVSAAVLKPKDSYRAALFA